MQAPEDPTHPDELSAATNRRARRRAAAGSVVAVVAVAVVTGIAYAVTSTKPEVKVAELALTVGRRAPDRLVPVRGYSKMQAYGPNRSLRRPIDVGPHFRGAAQAA